MNTPLGSRRAGTVLRIGPLLAGLLTSLVLLAPAPAGNRSARGEDVRGLDTFRQRLSRGEPTRIVCLGDSITGAYYHTGGVRAWPDMLGIALEQVYPQARIEVVNAGISGHTTVDALARLDRDVIARQPQLVVIMLGMNDVTRLPLDQFIRNLGDIVDRCRGATADVVLCTPNFIHDSPSRPLDKLAELSQRVRDLAMERRLPVADWFADGQSQRENDRLTWMLSMSDEIHPNMHGHRRLAVLVSETLTGKQPNLADVAPPADVLHHTFARLEAGKPLHVVAMPPYDEWMATALRQHYPQAEIHGTSWPTADQNLADLSRWAQQVRALQPDLVIPAVPARLPADDVAGFVRDYEWVLNWSFPFEGRGWDVLPVVPTVTEPGIDPGARQLVLARRICLGKDVRPLDRTAGDVRPAPELLADWLAEQRRAYQSRDRQREPR